MQEKLPMYEELIKPLTPLSSSWFKWGSAKVFLNTLGRLSCGVRIGFYNGFDSGQMLDYVYKNKPQGTSFIGKLIDKTYLNSPGWTGIRQRKVHLKKILQEIIDEHQEIGEQTVIMDLASGPGQYLIEVVQENPEAHLQVICRDLNEAGLEEGRKKARELNLTKIRYEKADAFSRKDLQSASPQPNVIVVSGLYELFTDNGTIQQSMRNISKVLNKDDYFVFTNQPCHPQLEMIARVLPNRLGEPWVMKLRSDETVKQWAFEASFQFVRQLIDQWGIFSVICMKKYG